MYSFHIDVLRQELRILGLVLFATPAVVVVTVAQCTAMLFVGHVPYGFIANLLIGSLEALLPLVVGILLAGAAVQDPSLELLLTLNIPYRFIAFRRFALILQKIHLS